MQTSVLRQNDPSTTRSPAHPSSAEPLQIRRLLLVGGNPNLLSPEVAAPPGAYKPELTVAVDRASLVQSLTNGQFDTVMIDAETLPYAAHQLCGFIRATAPNIRVIVLAHFADINNVTTMLEAGANTLLDRNYFAENLLVLPDCWTRLCTCQFSPDVSRLIFDTLSDYQVMFGGPCQKEQTICADISDEVAPAKDQTDEPAVLTTRESELLRLGAEGLPASQIGAELHLSTHTVNTHLKNIYRKLGVNRRGEAISRARELGEI